MKGEIAKSQNRPLNGGQAFFEARQVLAGFRNDQIGILLGQLSIPDVASQRGLQYREIGLGIIPRVIFAVPPILEFVVGA